MVEEKFCPGCKQVKSPDAFYRRSRSKDGLANKCKACESLDHKKRYARVRTKMIHRRSKLKLNYGITISEFNKMFDEQEGACAICGMTGVKLVVDHDHGTGKVRRLLCSGCNHGLGRFRDDPDLLLRAVDYLVTYGYTKPS